MHDYRIMIKDESGWRMLTEKYIKDDVQYSRPYSVETLDELSEKYLELMKRYGQEEILPIDNLTAKLTVNIGNNSESEEVDKEEI